MDRLWSREEILKMVEKYGTNKEEINLLWTNEDQSSEFPKSQINLLKLMNYKKIIIFYKNINSDKYFNNFIIYLNNGTTILRRSAKQLIYINDSIFYRNISIETLTLGQIIFDNCIENNYNNKTSENNNNYLVPCYICGVN